MPSRSTSAPARRHIRPLVTGIALTAAAAAGLLTASPAFASSIATQAAPYALAATPGAETLHSVNTRAQDAEDAAHTALAAARAITDEISASGLDVGVDPKIDTTDLASTLDRMPQVDLLTALLPDFTDDLVKETVAVSAKVADLRQRLADAQAKKAAEEAAAAAAAAEAQRQAEAAAAAAALAAANTPEGAKATAQQMASSQYGWGGDQFSCLVNLWNRESGWNYKAYNPSGATGIPQALPGSKMASAGSDWQSNATTQIAWGLGYISAVYGTPCAAWGHSNATNWY